LYLTGDSGNIIRAAFLEGGVKSLSTAASSLSRKWFVWESVWVFTTTSSFGIFDSVNQWATGFLVKSWLLVLFVNGTSSDEQVEDFQDEDTFDFASTVGAEVGVSDWVDSVESVAVEDQVGFSGTGSWEVLNFPWDARVVSGGFFEIEHATVITIGQFFTEVIDTVDWFSVTSSVVVFKVAPATVLVDSVEVFAGENIGDGSWLRSVGLDQRSNVPVGQFVHLVFHGLEAGLGEPDEEGRGESLQLHNVFNSS